MCESERVCVCVRESVCKMIVYTVQRNFLIT